MGEALTHRPHLPKLLGDDIVHLRRLLLCRSPGLIGLVVALLCQLFSTEMFLCRVPGMMRQPPLERRTRYAAQSRPSVLRPRFEQCCPYPEPTLMSHGVSLPLCG